MPSHGALKRVPWQPRTSVLLLLVCGLLLGLDLAGYVLLERFWQPSADSAAILLPSARAFLAPEPVERLMFLLNLVLVPPLLVLGVGALSVGGTHRRWWPDDRLEAGLSAAAAMLLLLPLPTASAVRAVIGEAGLKLPDAFLHSTIALGLAALVLLSSLQARKQAGRRSLRATHRLRTAALTFSLFCMTLGLVSYRLVRFGRLTGSGVWSDHLDAVVSATSQVLAGRTLLVDVPSQYGLFPELLAPLLRLLPSGLAGLSLAFAALQLVSLVALLLVLRSRVRNALVLFAAALALAMVTFGVHGLCGFRFGEADPYFQYWPVRFVGPALSVPIVLRVLGRLSWPRLLGLGGWIALCLFWNLDSGVAVLYAVAMTLLLLAATGLFSGRRIGGWPWRPLLAASVLVPGSALLLLAGLGGLLSLKAGAPLDIGWLTGFQATFYGLGFMMLPLPPWPEAWHNLIAAYVIALVIASRQLTCGHAVGRVLPLLYLPLLGMGLFTYYQGRSHFFNLVAVCWPMIMVIAILVDRHLLGMRRGLLPAATSGLPLAGLTALLLPALALLQCFPRLVELAADPLINQPDPWQPPAPHLASELDMVRRFCTGSQPPCLLLTRRQGIYALEAGTASNWRGPSPAEMLLQADRSRLRRLIRQGIPSRILLGVGPNSTFPHLGLTMRDDFRRYRVADTNPERTLLLLIPKEHAPPPAS